MTTNPYQSPRSLSPCTPEVEVAHPLPTVPSWVLLAMMPLYFLLNWAALRSAGFGRLWEVFDLFTFVVPPLLLTSLLIMQTSIRPFRWWAVVVVAGFLVGMGVLNRWLSATLAASV